MPRVRGVADRWDDIRKGAVLLEDEAVLALNKPAGISVLGERHETDLVRIAAEAGQTLFPVHRIDKVTSGVVLFAKELRFHADLTRQFHRRTVDKVYLAITRSSGLPEAGTVDLPLCVGRKNRVRIAANRADIVVDEARHYWSVPAQAEFTHVRRYPARTTFVRVWGDDQHTLLAVRPISGRRHQIRVHLAWIGHPIDGDPLFEKRPARRTALHSWRLSFTASWRGNARLHVEGPPGDDFFAPVRDRIPGGDTAALLDAARARIAAA